ncbi:SMC-Scp complex subunit ScpB [Candidatus Micrarchaeota archaeon]|nr:SMC-Scp complex subunit ScpB [Candidatus Micrarchaeota archaeon]
MKEEKKLIEAALFMSARPMALEEFRTLTGIGALGFLQSTIEELKKEYVDRAIEISENDGRYEMRIRPEYVEKVKQYAQETELSKSALRTLAYISKHDGMLKSDLVKRIGSQVYIDVKELVEAGFVKTPRAGRTTKLVLTDKFRKYFVIQNVPVVPDNSQTTLNQESESSTQEPAPSEQPQIKGEEGEHEME